MYIYNRVTKIWYFRKNREFVIVLESGESKLERPATVEGLLAASFQGRELKHKSTPETAKSQVGEALWR